MRAFQNRPRLRWLVPIVAVTALVAGGLVAGTAAAEPSLPEQSAEQLVAKVAASRPTQFSGTAETRADLGLPELPGSRRGSDFEALLSGENTIRVWVGTEQQTRVAVHGTFGESDLVRDGSDVWLWNSRERTAVHSKVTGGKDRSAESAPTPQQLAAQAIEAIEPTTRISVARNVTVAGRAAYELVLEPKDDRSLIEQVRIAVDGERFLPLRVQIFGEGSDRPAAEAAFTRIDFSAPDPGVFEFTPPAGTEVVEPDDHDRSGRPEKPGKSDHPRSGEKPAVIGKGWTAVHLIKGERPDRKAEQDDILEALPRVSGSWGTGRLFSSRLVTAVITDDGRIAVGPVRSELLYAALER